MRSRGITLIELLISLTITVIIVGAMARAYSSSLGFDQRLREGRQDLLARQDFEDKITNILKRAYLSTVSTTTNSYFLGGNAAQTSTASTLTSSTQSGSSGADTLTFTVIGARLPGKLLYSTNTFEENNQNIGPIGGVTEVSLSMTAVGDNPDGKTGLFMRQQTPSDEDPTQGGKETLLNGGVSSITFEYYDGTQWLTDWDTRTQTTKRLPSTIRVTYKFNSDSEDHILYVRVPLSDVTTTNPVTEAG